MEQDKAVAIDNIQFMARSLTRLVEDLQSSETPQDFYSFLVDYGLIVKYYGNPVQTLAKQYREIALDK